MNNSITLPAPDQSIDFSEFLPSLHEIAAKKAEYWQVVKDWTTKKIVAALGYLNLVTFKIGMDFEALQVVSVDPRTNANTYGINRQNLANLIEISATGNLTYAFATTGVSKYLQECWPAAANSLPTLRKIRETFSSEFGLFAYEKIAPSGRKCDCPPPEWRQIDFIGLLLLHEVLEEHLCDGNTSGIHPLERRRDELPEEIPPHRGMWTIMLFEEAFKDLDKKFNRVVEEPVLFTFSVGYMDDEQDYQEVAEDVWAMVSAEVEEEKERYLQELERSWQTGTS